MSRPRPSANDGVSVNHGLAGVTDGLSTINLDHSAVTSLHLDLSGFEMVRAALWTEFEETGDSSVLDQVIECDEEILEMCPIGHQGRADACMRLSASLYSQMEFVPVVSPFALADDGVSREDQLETTRMIRDTLWVEYEQTRDADTLEQVIQLDERTMALCPVGHRDRALACAYLASSLQSKLFHTARFSATDRNHDPAIDPSTLELSSAALRSWLDRYRDTDDPKQLDQLISVRRRVLKYFPYDHHFRPMTCYLLAQSLNKKYQQSGDMDVLEEVVRLQREARTLCPPEDKMRAAMCHALGMSSHNLFLHTHDTALIDDAIEFLRESLVLYPHGHADRVVSCGNLAVVLTARYNHGPDLIFLDEAIILERQVLELIPPDHPQYAASCNNLASSLSLRYSQTRDDDLLREVIELQRKVLDVYPSVDQGRAIACGNLAHTLRIYSDQTGDIEVLDESLRLNREALSLFSRNSPHRASACLSLMRYLQERYEKTNDVGLLSELTQLQREALALCSPRHPRRADACLNLADTLSKRYRQTGDIDLIDECIGLQREALRLQFAGNLDHSFACKALAGSLATLYAHGNNNTALDEAIVLARQSLTECPPNSDEHAALSLNLVAYIIYRYKQLRHVDDLQEAIHICRSVLESTACTDTVRVGVCINLATCLRHLHESTGNTEPLDEAIEVMEQASAFSDSSKSWRISISLCELYLLWGSGHPTHRASISMSRALESLNAASQAQNDDIGAFMDGMFSTLLSTIWSIHESWRHSNVCLHLVPVYARVIDNLPLMAAFALNTGSRLRGLRSYTQIGSQACVVALEAECSPRAIEMLDQAHGVIWTQALHQRDPELTGVPHELATELHGLLRAIDLPINMVMDHDHLAPQDVRHAHNSRIQTLLGEIRAIPGLERFMRGYEFEQLRQVAIDHPVVVLVAMDSENYAVIISRASQDVPDVIKLDVTSETMLQLRSNMHRSGARWRTTTEEGYSEVVEDADASERLMRPGGYDYSLTGVLSRLWKLIVKPVLSHLGFEKQERDRRPRLHWCATGHFASLPIHAAGVYTADGQECSSDYVITSYAPTLSSLLRAQRERPATLVHGSKLALVSATHASSGLAPLPNVGTEIDLVTGIALSVGAHPHDLSSAAAARSEMAKALESASIVHIACHGIQNVEDPLQSAFHLSNDRRLSVSDLMELDLKHAHLAFLSACETAKGDRAQPDQAIHLAATMLFVGFRSIIGTMWAMRDEDGPAVAQAFYEKLFEGTIIENDAIPRALDDAVRKLRDDGVSPERWATFMHIGA